MSSSLWQALITDDAPLSWGTVEWRSMGAAKTLARVRPIARELGVTRLGDITGLDWLGLPVFQAVRPASRNISVSLGKGLTADLSRVSALMEAIECEHAESAELPLVSSTWHALRGSLSYDPNELLTREHERRERSRLGSAEVLDWLPATELTAGDDSFVPRRLCDLNFGVDDHARLSRFDPTSNGLASGNTIAEAVIHGLCELVERDCWCDATPESYDEARAVDLESAPWPEIQQLVLRLERSGVELHVFDRSGEIPLPCYEALLASPDLGVFGGLGCHPDPMVALLRAILESAQGRLAHIAGSRDDLCRDDYRRRAGPLPRRVWPRARRRVAPASPAQRPTQAETALAIARAIERHTGFAPLAIDLTRPRFGLPVLFCVAPGLRPPTVKLRVAPRIQRLPTAPAQLRRVPHVVAFIGPTIPGSELRARLAAACVELELRPPVQQGDLYRLLGDQLPDVVIVIDGEFRQVPSVLHKEVLALLARGVRVLGAGSMGALRASELWPFGMEGFGQVFAQYQSGRIEADDEVAVAHRCADGQYAALSVALVNFRAQLDAAIADGVMTAEVARQLLDAARSLHFSERRLETIFHTAGFSGVADAQLRWLKRSQIDVKRSDVQGLLDELCLRLIGRRDWPSVPRIESRDTKYSRTQANSYVGARIGNVHVPDWFVLAFDSLVSPDFSRFCLEVKLGLFDSLAARAGSPIEARKPARSSLFVAVRGLGLSPAQAWRSVEHGPGLPWGASVLVESKRQGRFARVANVLKALLDAAPQILDEADGPVELQRRLVAARWRVRHSRLDAAAQARGFSGVAEVLPAAALLLGHRFSSLRLLALAPFPPIQLERSASSLTHPKGDDHELDSTSRATP
jgi:ribosomal protein S12 methylthiotransferase accessory factor